MSDDNAGSQPPAQPPEEEDNEITPVHAPPTSVPTSVSPTTQVPPPIVMESSTQTFSLPSYPTPSTTVELPRIEGTLLFPPVPELTFPPHPLEQEEIPVILSGAPSRTSVPTMSTPITPTFPMPPPGIAGPSFLHGYLSPFRQVSPTHPLEQQFPPPSRQGAQTYLLSTSQQQPEEPVTSAAATPFQSYLRNPHIRERSSTTSPVYQRGGSGDEISPSRRKEFDHNEYLELGSDFPEEAHLPQDATPNHVEMVAAFQNHLKNKGNSEDKASMSALIRHVIPVLGVKMFQIRCELHSWYKDWIRKYGSVSVVTQKEFAFLLIESDVYEDKLAAVLFMQEILISKRHISHADMPRFEAMFRSGHIKVYKVCDHFADKVLCYLARQGSQDMQQTMVDTLFTWTRADDLWQARAGLSALSNQAGKVLLHERLLEAVKHLMSRSEEEAKSTAGTALRSISDVDAVTAIEFLNRPENIGNTSVNALQKATSRLTKEQKEHFKTLRRDVVASRRR